LFSGCIVENKDKVDSIYTTKKPVFQKLKKTGYYGKIMSKPREG